MPDPAASSPRFVALDVHRQYVMVAAIDADQQLLLPPRRMSFPAFADWAPAHLSSSDRVVLEATANAWHLYDQLVPLVASVQVANPVLVKAISTAKVKTDARDTLALARLLAGGLIPAIWIPPKEVRDLRALLAHRRRLVEWRTRARNRLHSVLHRHNLAPPAGEPFAAHQRVWWQALPLSPYEQLQVRQDWALLESIATTNARRCAPTPRRDESSEVEPTPLGANPAMDQHHCCCAWYRSLPLRNLLQPLVQPWSNHQCSFKQRSSGSGHWSVFRHHHPVSIDRTHPQRHAVRG